MVNMFSISDCVKTKIGISHNSNENPNLVFEGNKDQDSLQHLPGELSSSSINLNNTKDISELSDLTEFDKLDQISKSVADADKVFSTTVSSQRITTIEVNKETSTVFLSQSCFETFAGYIYCIWKYGQTKIILSEATTSLASSQKPRLKSYSLIQNQKENSIFNEVETVNIDLEDSTTYKPTPKDALNTIEVMDVDTQLARGALNLEKFQNEPKQRENSEEDIYFIHPRRIEGICCACQRDIDWDELRCDEFTIVSENLHPELELQSSVSPFIKPEDSESIQNEPVKVDKLLEDEREELNHTKIKDKSEDNLVKENESGPIEDKVIENNSDTDTDSDLDSVEILPVSSSEITRDVIIESDLPGNNEEDEDCHLSEDSGFSNHVGEDCVESCFQLSTKLCGISDDDLRLISVKHEFSKTNLPHPSCPHNHRICVPCKDVIFSNNSDKFCPECVFRNQKVHIINLVSRFNGFSLVNEKISVKTLLDISIEQFYSFLKNFVSEDNFRLV